MDRIVSDATSPQTQAPHPQPGVGATFRAVVAGTSIERRHRSLLPHGDHTRSALPSAAPAGDASRLAL